MPSTPKKRPDPRPKETSRAKTPRVALPSGSKLDRITAALKARNGASIPELMKVTGWQAHSVRGALAGALKKRGLAITSQRVGDERRYRIGSAA